MFLPVFLYLVGFLIVIFYYLLTLSLTEVSPDFTEHFPALHNFREIFASESFSTAFLNTAGFVLIGTPLELLAGLVLALLVHKSFAWRGLARSLFIVPLAVPAIVTAIILFILFSYPNGHVNNLLLGKYFFFPPLLDQPVNFRSSAFLSLGISLLGKVWRDMPISMLILLAGLTSINADQYLAAETMGANERQKFRYITLPLLLPAISSVLLIRSIEMWKEFIFPYFLARRYRLLGTYIEELYHDWHQVGEATAVSVVLVACIIAFAALLFWGLKRVRMVLVKI
jgi:ABC-type sugar transport system permease subunit